MTCRRCPVPNCTEPVPAGDYAVFCLEHHFQLPPAETAFLFRFQMQCTRRGETAYLAETLPGHVARLVRMIETAPQVREFSGGRRVA